MARPLAWLVSILLIPFTWSCNEGVDVEPYNEAGKPLRQDTFGLSAGSGSDFGTLDNPQLPTITDSMHQPSKLPPTKPGTMIDVRQFHDQIHAPPGAVVVDLRTPSQYIADHLDMARNIPYDNDFKARLSGISKDSVILFYDADGRTAPSALVAAQLLGYTHVFGLTGGLAVWEETQQGHMMGGKLNMGDIEVENYKTLDHEAFHGVMHNMSDLQILDVRPAHEYAKAHIADAVNFDLNGSQFSQQILTFSTTKPLLVYSANGKQAAKAAAILKANGFQVVYDMSSPFEDFLNARYGHIEPASAIPPAPGQN